MIDDFTKEEKLSGGAVFEAGVKESKRRVYYKLLRNNSSVQVLKLNITSYTYGCNKLLLLF